MSSCKVTAANGEPSRLHPQLFRYYEQAGLPADEANGYAVADWVHSQTDSFNKEHTNLVRDSNGEPELYYSGTTTEIPEQPLSTVSAEELHKGLAGDITPVYMKVVNGIRQAINAVRAKPSVLGYDPKKHPYDSLDNLKILGNRLSTRFGVPIQWLSRQDAIKNPNYKGQAAFIQDGVAYAIEGQATAAHLIHEVFGHPILEMLQLHRPEVYSGITNQALRNETLKEWVRREYPNEVDANGILTEAGQKEVVLKALELDASGKLETYAKGFAPFIRRLWDALKDLLGMKKSDVLNSRSTVGDLTRIVLGSDSLDLEGYAPEGFHASMTGAVPLSPAELAEQIKKESTLDGRIIFEDGGLSGGKYVDTKDPTKVIRRVSEVVEVDLVGESTIRDHEERADTMARAIFDKQDKDPNNPNDKVYITGKKRLFTFTQLKYQILRELNEPRKYGKLGHAVVEKVFSDDPAIDAKIAELEKAQTHPEDSSIVVARSMDADKQFSWLYGDPEFPEREPPISIMQRMLGYDMENGSVALTEQVIYDEEWGIGTTADNTIIYPDNELGDIDYKFGDIEGGYSDKIMKYMDLNAMGAARANRVSTGFMALVMRSVMRKKKRPSLKWKYMKLLALRDTANPVRLLDSYSLQYYLDAISAWEADNFPQHHKKNVEAGLYKIDNYYGSTLEDYKMREEAERKSEGNEDKYKELMDPVKVQGKLLDSMVMHISQLEQIKKEGEGIESAPKRLIKDIREGTERSLAKLTRTLAPQEIMAKSDDLAWKIISDNVNQYDVNNNLVIAIKDLRNDRAQQREERKVYRESVIAKLIEDLRKAKGVYNTKFIGANISVGGMPFYDPKGKGFWNFMFVEESSDTGKEGTKVRFISKTIDKEKWDRLLPAERAYLEYALTKMEEQYNKSMGRMVKTATGEQMSKAKALGLPEKWDPENAMVYLPMLREEESERNHGVMAAVKRFGQGIMDAWIRDEYDEHAREHSGLPVKYMYLPENMQLEHVHSLNGEHVFLRFMEHMDHIELMEDVYALAKGTQVLLKYYDIHGKVHYKNLQDYFDSYIKQHIVGIREYQDIIAGRVKGEEGKVKGASVLKMLEAARQITTFGTLSFQPVLATLNGVLITSMNYKAAGVNAIAKNMLGVKDVDFGPLQMAQGQKDYVQLQADIIAGTYEKNKLYHMLKEWKWAPDNYSFSTMKKNMGYAKNGLKDPGHLLFLHALVENMGNVSILAALTRSMKVKAGGKEVSVYDAYDTTEVTDPDTGKKIRRLTWKAGVRGYVGPEGDRQEVTKLTTPEIDALRKASARLTGDYRQDEKGAAEMNAIWNLAKQFKRFMFRYAKNMLDGRKLDATIGKYIDSGEVVTEEDGSKVPVLKWERTLTEGWGRTMINGLMCTLLMTNRSGFRKLATHFKMGNIDEFIEQYRWSNLSDFQKTNVARGATNFALMMLGIVGYFGVKDDDLLRKRLKKIIGDLTEGGNFNDMLRAIANPFPAITKVSNVLQYGSEYTVAAIMGERTREGNIKGERNLFRQFAPFAAIQQVEDIAEGK
jgi:hypothetical protein